jgi:hypothetical protein
MAYRFQSKAAADVLMLQAAGDSVLAAMGLAPASKGIIEAPAMLSAIRSIEAAVARDAALRPAGRGIAPDAQAPAEDAEPVSLRQRAWPLVEMMRRAHAAGEAIVWGV